MKKVDKDGREYYDIKQREKAIHMIINGKRALMKLGGNNKDLFDVDDDQHSK